LKILQVCAELFPFVKTGGLADVCGALPAALAAQGCEVRVLLPGLPAFLRGLPDARPVETLVPVPGVRLLLSALPDGTPAYLIASPLFEREGSPYAGPDGRPFDDNHKRFALLGRIAAMLAEALDPRWRPEVVHAHDWHAALAPAYLKAASARLGRRIAGSVFTVHNLAYQGLFPMSLKDDLGLPPGCFGMQGMEFYGELSFMKAGLVYADRLTTVSPSYAREVQDPEQGCGLDGVLRERSADLVGILNGVDPAVWDPQSDPLIAERYGPDAMAGKAACRSGLQDEFGLVRQDAAPLLGIVSRLTEQKGLPLVQGGLPALLAQGAQIVVLGSGDRPLEQAFAEAAAAHPRQVAVRIGYDESLAHRIVAGADAIAVPSRFEPCGLTQLYGLRYGTLPLVRRVGGLADTVVDCALENLDDDTATGVVFDAFSVAAFEAAVRRLCALHRRPQDWRQVQRRAMAQRFDWETAARAYIAVYQQVAGGSAGGGVVCKDVQT